MKPDNALKLTTLYKPNWKLALGIPLIIFISCFVITFTSKFKSNQELLSNAILLDLLIIAPIAYFLAIRKSSVANITVLRIFIMGLLFAGFILNAQSNAYLSIIKTWISPVIELTLISYIARKFYTANKNARLTGRNNLDFLIHCRNIMGEITGNEKAGNLISSEIGVIYYAFFGRKAKDTDNNSKFTSYKENGILLILGTFLVLFILETIGVHFLLNLWNNTFAWIFTALSLYTCLQLFAHIRALKARPVTLYNDSLAICNGLAGDAIISYVNIEKIEYSGKLPIEKDFIKIALLRKLEKHNCIIYLKEPVKVTIFFGLKRKADKVLFFIDNINEFKEKMKLKLIS